MSHELPKFSDTLLPYDATVYKAYKFLETQAEILSETLGSFVLEEGVEQADILVESGEKDPAILAATLFCSLQLAARGDIQLGLSQRCGRGVSGIVAAFSDHAQTHYKYIDTVQDTDMGKIFMARLIHLCEKYTLHGENVLEIIDAANDDPSPKNRYNGYLPQSPVYLLEITRRLQNQYGTHLGKGTQHGELLSTLIENVDDYAAYFEDFCSQALSSPGLDPSAQALLGKRLQSLSLYNETGLPVDASFSRGGTLVEATLGRTLIDARLPAEAIDLKIKAAQLLDSIDSVPEMAVALTIIDALPINIQLAEYNMIGHAYPPELANAFIVYRLASLRKTPFAEFAEEGQLAHAATLAVFAGSAIEDGRDVQRFIEARAETLPYDDKIQLLQKEAERLRALIERTDTDRLLEMGTCGIPLEITDRLREARISMEAILEDYHELFENLQALHGKTPYIAESPKRQPGPKR